MIFAHGKEAAAALVRALAVPDPAAQLAVARLLIETHGKMPAVIEWTKRREITEDPWPGEAARAAMLERGHHAER